MADVKNMTAEVEARYRGERDQRVLAVVRRMSVAALALVTVGWTANLALFAGRPGDRLVGGCASVLVCAATAAASRAGPLRRHPVAVAAGFVTALGLTSLWALSLDAESNAMVGTMATMMVGAALLFAWGPGPQVAVSGAIVAGFGLIVDWPALRPTEAYTLAAHVVIGCFLSLAGAVVLERQRRALFVEREQAQTLARHRELLLDVGRELNATMDLRSLLPRIVARCAEIVGCRGASLTLVDPERAVVELAAIASNDTDTTTIHGMEFPIDDQLLGLLDDLRTRHVVEVPVDAPRYDMGPYMRAYGVTCTLVAAVRHGDQLLGWLGLYLSGEGARFTDDQKQIADGLGHQAAIALANARLVDALTAANRLKSEFVSTMSHELRTPLNVIVGYTEMLEDGVDRGQAPARIRAASNELLDLIEATLDLGRLESGRDVAELAPVSLRPFWTELERELTVVPRHERVRLEWRHGPDGVVLTDRRKLKAIAKNLVGNALKYTLDGEVSASWLLDRDVLELVVRDTGIGIAPEQLPHIFEMFRQVDGSDARSFGGVGLGLFIVRRLVDQLGGAIDVESTLGRGSTFRVRLPVSAVVEPGASAA